VLVTALRIFERTHPLPVDLLGVDSASNKDADEGRVIRP
jgi:hypothetical protein